MKNSKKWTWFGDFTNLCQCAKKRDPKFENFWVTFIFRETIVKNIIQVRSVISYFPTIYSREIVHFLLNLLCR